MCSGVGGLGTVGGGLGMEAPAVTPIAIFRSGPLLTNTPTNIFRRTTVLSLSCYRRLMLF